MSYSQASSIKAMLDWTIPEIEGYLESHVKYDILTSGVFTQRWARGPGFRDGGGENSYYGDFSLKNVAAYVGHDNTGSQFHPRHYQVNWYIKRRYISS